MALDLCKYSPVGTPMAGYCASSARAADERASASLRRDRGEASRLWTRGDLERRGGRGRGGVLERLDDLDLARLVVERRRPDVDLVDVLLRVEGERRECLDVPLGGLRLPLRERWLEGE